MRAQLATSSATLPLQLHSSASQPGRSLLIPCTVGAGGPGLAGAHALAGRGGTDLLTYTARIAYPCNSCVHAVYSPVISVYLACIK